MFIQFEPIPVAVRSTARVYGRSLAGNAGSNLARGMDVCVMCYRVKLEEQARTIRTKNQKTLKKRKNSGEKTDGAITVCLLCLLCVV